MNWPAHLEEVSEQQIVEAAKAARRIFANKDDWNGVYSHVQSMWLNAMMRAAAPFLQAKQKLPSEAELRRSDDLETFITIRNAALYPKPYSAKQQALIDSLPTEAEKAAARAAFELEEK